MLNITADYGMVKKSVNRGYLLPEQTMKWLAEDVDWADCLGGKKKTKQNKKQTNKLHGPYSASQLYRLIDRHLSTKFIVNFCG
jgi:hypothetical protein